FMGGVVVCPLLCQGRGGIRLMPVTIVLADAGDDRLGSPADKTGSAAWFHCSHFLCRAFSPVTAVVSGIAVVRRSNEADAHGLEASCRHGRVGAPLETDAVAQSRRAGRARRHLTI